MPLPAWACSPTTRAPQASRQRARAPSICSGAHAELGLRARPCARGRGAPAPARDRAAGRSRGRGRPPATRAADGGCRRSPATPSSKPRRYSSRGAKLGVKRSRAAVESREQGRARASSSRGRDALEAEPGVVEEPAARRMAVRLDRVEDAVHGVERRAAPRRRRAASRVVDVDRRPARPRAPAARSGGRATTRCAAPRPPPPAPAEQLAPGRAEQRALPPCCANSSPCSWRDQPLALVLVDDEGEVEVARRLASRRWTLLLLEQPRSTGPSSCRMRADAAADQATPRRSGAITRALQSGARSATRPASTSASSDVGGRVERDRDVRLRASTPGPPTGRAARRRRTRRRGSRPAATCRRSPWRPA